MKKLIKLALLVGGVALAGKALAAQKADFAGLTETEARARLDAKLPDKIPYEKRTEIADKVVGKMKEKGVLSDDAQPEAGTA